MYSSNIRITDIVEAVGDHVAILLPLGLLSMIVFAVIIRRPGSGEPPALPETIPFISNASHYMTNLQSFTDRARHPIHRSHQYPPVSTTINSDRFVLMVYEHLDWLTPPDLAQFARDKTAGWPARPREQDQSKHGCS
ncbi:hypothetical protein BX600DRAFT_551413 [Xylariales sp. PMI_506]|nr:hypothetical protein BX600DRAFT_551413 [Xylariales sp. PMI_506]